MGTFVAEVTLVPEDAPQMREISGMKAEHSDALVSFHGERFVFGRDLGCVLVQTDGSECVNLGMSRGSPVGDVCAASQL